MSDSSVLGEELTDLLGLGTLWESGDEQLRASELGCDQTQTETNSLGVKRHGLVTLNAGSAWGTVGATATGASSTSASAGASGYAVLEWRLSREQKQRRLRVQDDLRGGWCCCVVGHV